MKKKVIITVVGIALLIIAIGYYIHYVNRVNTECMRSLEPLSREIYEYRDAYGHWPESILAFTENKKKTTRGVSIIYERANLSITAECAHPGIPFLDRLDSRPGGTNYSRVESHGINLDIGYKRWKEQAAYESWHKKLKDN